MTRTCPVGHTRVTTRPFVTMPAEQGSTGIEEQEVDMTEELEVKKETRLRGEALVEKVKKLLHEGNVRRLVIKNDKGDTVLEVPVTAGVVVAIAAPVVTAVAAIAALAGEWSIEVERHKAPQDTG